MSQPRGMGLKRLSVSVLEFGGNESLFWPFSPRGDVWRGCRHSRSRGLSCLRTSRGQPALLELSIARSVPEYAQETQHREGKLLVAFCWVAIS